MIPQPTAHPETLKIIQAVHDTVRDTIVRVAAPQRHDPPTWVLTVITAVAAVTAGVVAQWFRVLLDDNRERERIRQVLMLEVAALGVWLERIEGLATAWQLPGATYFWRQMDDAMRGFDQLHTRLPLVPGPVRVQATAWFLKVRSIRLGGEQVASDYAKEHEATAKNDVLYRRYDRVFTAIERDAAEERKRADEVFKSLYEAVPANWFRRVGAGIEQKFRSLEEARREGEKLGLLPRDEPQPVVPKPTPPASRP